MLQLWSNRRPWRSHFHTSNARLPACRESPPMHARDMPWSDCCQRATHGTRGAHLLCQGECGM
eukprot:365130-Chlamydomonas_euryale.AAC.18